MTWLLLTVLIYIIKYDSNISTIIVVCVAILAVIYNMYLKLRWLILHSIKSKSKVDKLKLYTSTFAPFTNEIYNQRLHEVLKQLIFYSKNIKLVEFNNNFKYYDEFLYKYNMIKTVKWHDTIILIKFMIYYKEYVENNGVCKSNCICGNDCYNVDNIIGEFIKKQ
jgi:hypothetical protein